MTITLTTPAILIAYTTRYLWAVEWLNARGGFIAPPSATFGIN